MAVDAATEDRWTVEPTLAWFDHLAAAGNTRELWAERKHAYAAGVRAPFAAYLDALDAAPGVPVHGPWRVYRPHNDVRFAPDQLVSWRAAVADDVSGTALTAVLTRTQTAGLASKGGRPVPLVRPPRGAAADHPWVAWLRWKGVEVVARLGRAAWSEPTTRVEAAATSLATAAPLLAWLGEHVGPSTLPRPRR